MSDCNSNLQSPCKKTTKKQQQRVGGLLQGQKQQQLFGGLLQGQQQLFGGLLQGRLTFLMLRMTLNFWVAMKLSSMIRMAMLTSSSLT